MSENGPGCPPIASRSWGATAIPIAAVVLAAVSHAGCATTRQRESLQELEESLEAYNEAFRWKNYERAAGYLPADQRASFLGTYEDEENSLHVEDFQILRVDMAGDDAAIASVRVRYMLLPSVNVGKTTLVQHWHRVNGTWVMEREENSIRELDRDKTPRNPEAFGGPDPEGDPGETKVRAEGPGGAVLRDDGLEDPDEGEGGED